MKYSTVTTIVVLLLLAGRASAGTDSPIPELVPRDHWSCREIAELATRFSVDKKLPERETLAKRELAAEFLAVVEKVMGKCEREGSDVLSRKDLERLGALHEALKEELNQFEGYLRRREMIEKMLTKHEEPAFEYKIGLNGFLRGEGAGNLHLVDNSSTPGHGEGRFVYRVKPYLYWHPTDWLDIHVEGEGYGFTGGSQEHNQISLYQGYAEARLPGSDLLALKGGRQEFGYGSTYILGANSFYDGLSYDALLLRVRPTPFLAVDILWGTYASPFDTGLKGNLSGVYATYTVSDGNAVEAYLLRDGGAQERHAGEHLDIFGLRGTVRLGSINIELEPVYESGRRFNGATHMDDGIDAYGGHLDLTYDAILAGNKNRLLAGYAYGTGSRGAVSGMNVSREFRNPNNDSSLFGDIGIMVDQSGSTVNGHHASGLQIYTLGWGMDAAKELNFSAIGHYYCANYVEPGFNRSVGLETDFTLTYTMTDNLSFIVGYDRFFTGAFFLDASGSGRDIDYGYFMVQFDLSRSKPKVRLAKG
jgi:hypothetical protein